MRTDKIQTYKGYKWIVHHKDLLGGKPTVKGTRLSVSLILNCLAIGMDADAIADDYENFPRKCIPEVLKFASEFLDHPVNKSNVAA